MLTALVSWINARLFGPASGWYALGAIAALVVSLVVVFGPFSFPLPAVYSVMLLALLASSRIFTRRPLRYYWWACTCMAALSLALCL